MGWYDLLGGKRAVGRKACLSSRICSKWVQAADGRDQPVGNPRVAAAVATFLRAHLDPLFQAKVIDKTTFKTAMQVTIPHPVIDVWACRYVQFPRL